MEKLKVKELDQVVVRFAGDSGDGMQLTGSIFSNISAIIGNEISTFPDYPAEIRAPQGTLGGVSGFQVHIGSGKVFTPGDDADVLVAMNPAALKVNAKHVKKGGVIIYDENCFEKSDLVKAGFVTDDPFEELSISDTISLVPAQLTTLTQKSLEGYPLDNKAILRSKNMFALGLMCWLFNRPMDQAIHFLGNKIGMLGNKLLIIFKSSRNENLQSSMHQRIGLEEENKTIFKLKKTLKYKEKLEKENKNEKRINTNS